MLKYFRPAPVPRWVSNAAETIKILKDFAVHMDDMKKALNEEKTKENKPC